MGACDIFYKGFGMNRVTPCLNLAFMRTVLGTVFCNVADYVLGVDISLDSRTLQPSDLYVALVGQKVDGHTFVDDVVRKGARAVMVDQVHFDRYVQKYQDTVVILGVPDTTLALIALAREYRSHFVIPVVGVTGTVGKTTTKDILGSVLTRAGFNPVCSYGNQNTLLGIAMTILKVRAQHTHLVCEMGISQPGFMYELAQLLQPTIGIITTIGAGHLQELESIERVSYEKRQIFAFCKPDQTAIVFGDQPLLRDQSYPCKVVTFGFMEHNNIRIISMTDVDNTVNLVVCVDNQLYTVVIPSCNHAYSMNAVAALSVAYQLGIDLPTIFQALAMPVVTKRRFEICPLRSGNVLINDAYNANPESMPVGLAAFDRYQTTAAKYVVVGDMKELGSESDFWHERLAEWVKGVSRCQQVVLIGQQARIAYDLLIQQNVCAVWFDSVIAAAPHVVDLAHKDNSILFLKASRSMNFDDLVTSIQNSMDNSCKKI